MRLRRGWLAAASLAMDDATRLGRSLAPRRLPPRWEHPRCDVEVAVKL
jgi:hypothetical protein